MIFCPQESWSSLYRLVAVLTLSEVEEGCEDDQSLASKRAKRNIPKPVMPVITVWLNVTCWCDDPLPYHYTFMQLPPFSNHKSSPQKQQQQEQQQQLQQSPPVIFNVNHTKTSIQQ